MEGEGGDSRRVVVLQVFLVPASSVGRVVKEGVIADHVPLDQANAGPFHLTGHVVQVLEYGSGPQVVGQARISSPDQDQVTFQNPVVLDLPLVPEAGFESEVGSQAVQNRRRREHLHGAGGNEVLQGIPGIEFSSAVDVAHFDSPRGAAVPLAVQQRVDLPRQFGVGPAGVFSDRRLRRRGGRRWGGIHFNCSGMQPGVRLRCRAGSGPESEADGNRRQESQNSGLGKAVSPVAVQQRFDHPW